MGSKDKQGESSEKTQHRMLVKRIFTISLDFGMVIKYVANLILRSLRVHFANLGKYWLQSYEKRDRRRCASEYTVNGVLYCRLFER